MISRKPNPKRRLATRYPTLQYGPYERSIILFKCLSSAHKYSLGPGVKPIRTCAITCRDVERRSAADLLSPISFAEQSDPNSRPNSILVFAGRMSTTDIGSTMAFSPSKFDNFKLWAGQRNNYEA